MGIEVLPRVSGERFAPRYDLTDEEISAATRESMNYMERPDGRYVAVVVSDADGPIANVARTVERRVFEDSFNNDASEMQQEYGKYDDAGARRFFVVVDTEHMKPAGVLGILKNSPAGFKSLKDAPSPVNIQDPDKCWDVGTLAVMPEYRGKEIGPEVSTLLYRSLFKLGEQEGITDLVAIVDYKAKRNLDALGVPFKPMANSEPFAYLGSETSYAVHGKLAEFRPAVVKRARILKALGAMVTLMGMEGRRSQRLVLAAKVAGRLAAGTELDSQIMMLLMLMVLGYYSM